MILVKLIVRKNKEVKKLKSIRFTIAQLNNFRLFVKTPRIVKVPEEANVVDLILLLDQEYHTMILNDGKDHAIDFLDAKIKSLLQLLWNPMEEKFYDDVGIKARTAPPESEALPIELDWRYVLPNNSWIVLTPDAGC